jgi:flagellar basal-body rod protein FlgG
MAQLRLLDTVTNNLANVNTAGFKQDILVTKQQSFSDTLASGLKTDPFAKGDQERTPGAVSVEQTIDMTVGHFKRTGVALDAALRNPNDFFVILTPNGPELTRGGNFTLDGTGNLVTQDGFPVSGGGGAITVNGPGATITPGGSVISNGAVVGQLQIQRIQDASSLQKVGNTRFRVKDGAAAGTDVPPDLETGVLESANISVTSAMVQMISAHRGFQAYTKVAGAIDEMNKDAVTQLVK